MQHRESDHRGILSICSPSTTYRGFQRSLTTLSGLARTVLQPDLCIRVYILVGLHVRSLEQAGVYIEHASRRLIDYPIVSTKGSIPIPSVYKFMHTNRTDFNIESSIPFATGT